MDFLIWGSVATFTDDQKKKEGRVYSISDLGQAWSECSANTDILNEMED